MENPNAKITIIGEGIPEKYGIAAYVACTDRYAPVRVVNNIGHCSAPNMRDMICGKKYTYFSDFNPQRSWVIPCELKTKFDGSLSIDHLKFDNLPNHSDQHDIALVEYNKELFMVYTIHDKIDQIISRTDSATDNEIGGEMGGSSNKIYDSNARKPPWNSWFGYYKPVGVDVPRPKRWQHGCSAQSDDGPLYFVTYDGDYPIIDHPYLDWRALDFSLPEFITGYKSSESFICTGNNGCFYFVGHTSFNKTMLSRRDPRCPSATYLGNSTDNQGGHHMRNINNINGVIYGLKSSNDQRELTAYEYDESADILLEINKQSGKFYAHYGICAAPQ